jgi:hypothetical protein
MKASDFRDEINFGLENLDKVFRDISYFAAQEIENQIKVSASAYGCMGYYNAIEHFIIRVIKQLYVW